jgi:hypothetical protein
MKIDLKFKKKEDPIVTNYPVPCSSEMRERLRAYTDKGFKINEMTRDFFKDLITLCEKQDRKSS